MRKETWAFLDTGNRSAAYNMAADEALLNWHSKGEIPPVVRFYGWEPAALSIGYFQKAQQEVNFEALRKHGLDFVRRPTGGRGVLHEHELTYSVIVNEEHPAMPTGVTEAYRVISEGVLQGFRTLGLDAEFAVPRTDEEKASLKNPRSSVCFDAPSWYELVVEGRKVAGSAQTRKKGVILQHGSILIDIDEDKLFSLFYYASERVKERMQRAFKEKAVAINAISPHPVKLEEVRAAFKKGFEQGLNINLEPLVLSEDQVQQIESIQKKRYENHDWNFRR